MSDGLDSAPLPEELDIPVEDWHQTPLRVRLVVRTLLKRLDTLEALLDPAEQHGMRLSLASANRLLGEIALTTNLTQREAPLAAPHFERSIAILQQIGAENELALTYAGYGRLHQQQGDLAQARAYLTRALAIFERLGTLHEPDRIRQLLALQEGVC